MAFCDLICGVLGVKIKALKPYRFRAFVLYAIPGLGMSVSVEDMSNTMLW